MSNLTNRLIALVLLLSHLLTSCGRWEVGECGRGEPGEPNGCGAPGHPLHGNYVEDTSGVSLMTTEGFIAAFNRIYPEASRIQLFPSTQEYFQPNLNAIGNPTLPIIPFQPNLSASQLSFIPNQRPIDLHLPSLGNSSSSFTYQFLNSGAARDMIGSLWSLGSTLTHYSKQTRAIEQYHEESANRTIAEMRAYTAQLKREQEESSRKLAIEEAQKEDKRRLAVKEKKEKEKEESEERLQKLIEHRREVETGRTRTIKPENYFIANSSTANVKRTQESINKLRQRLATNSGTAGLTSEQQGDVTYILERIDRLSEKLNDNIQDIKYFIEHPNPAVKYNAETLNVATKLLQDLSRQKDELRQLVSTRGVNSDNYVDVGALEPVETQEERNAYKELAIALNDPSDAMHWVAFATQQMKALLDANGSISNKSEDVKTRAAQLATRVGEVLQVLQSKKIAIIEAYFGVDTSDYIDHSIEEGIQKLRFIEETIDNLEESLDYFCAQFIVSPKADFVPTITKEKLKIAVNAVIDLLVPGSEILKTMLGTRPMPIIPEEWASLALEAGLDFVPLGKTLKIFIGPVNSIIHNKVKDFIVRLLKKKRKKVEKGIIKLLNQFNSVESLIEKAGLLTKVKAGMQGFVKGDGPTIFNSLIKSAILQPNGRHLLKDGTLLSYHMSKKTGHFTIDITTSTNNKLIKIRFTQ